MNEIDIMRYETMYTTYSVGDLEEDHQIDVRKEWIKKMVEHLAKEQAKAIDEMILNTLTSRPEYPLTGYELVYVGNAAIPLNSSSSERSGYFYAPYIPKMRSTNTSDAVKQLNKRVLEREKEIYKKEKKERLNTNNPVDAFNKAMKGVI